MGNFAPPFLSNCSAEKILWRVKEGETLSIAKPQIVVTHVEQEKIDNFNFLFVG